MTLCGIRLAPVNLLISFQDLAEGIHKEDTGAVFVLDLSVAGGIRNPRGSSFPGRKRLSACESKDSKHGKDPSLGKTAVLQKGPGQDRVAAPTCSYLKVHPWHRSPLGV